MASHDRIVFLDTPTTNIDSDNNTTQSFSYVLPAGTTNRLVVICIGQEDNTLSATDAPAVNFNGNATTARVNAEDNDAADDPGAKIYTFGCGSLVAGTYTIAITYAAAILNSLCVVFTLDNVDQNTPMDTLAVSNNGTDVTVTDAITTVTDRALVLQCLTNQDATGYTATGGQTVLFNAGWGSNPASTLVAYLQVESPSTVTPSATFPSSDWANGIIAIRPIRRRMRVT